VLVAQIVDNLLDNACKYSEAGSPVIVRVCQSAGDAVVSVVDRGQGIDQAELSQVFEPFFRSQASRWNGKGGSGLGLSIAHRFARLVGGRLDVASILGQGSEFRLILPLAAHTVALASLDRSLSHAP
jgi:signal transduction histidine kinase